MAKKIAVLFTICLLLVAIAAILLLSIRWKLNAFFALLIVAAGVGIVAGMDGVTIIGLLKTGLGSTIEKIGLLIVLGATLGLLLEKSGATDSLARFALARTGKSKAPLALSIIGFVVGLPIFCDSGFVVLSGLAVSLSAQSPGQRAWLVASLATGLYAVHCLVPPHPGITAATATLNVDLGKAMLLGTLAAIPPAAAGYFWAKWANRRWGANASQSADFQENSTTANSTSSAVSSLPSPGLALLPIVVPVLLIALKSFVLLDSTAPFSGWQAVLNIAGDPVVALLVGILLCLPLFFQQKKTALNATLEAALLKSGNILLITAAGGAFGEVIKALDIGEVFGEAFAASGLGLLIPFALAAVLKTAQGSSTVAVISTASILAPLLPALGLGGESDAVWALLAMGAGSIVASHTNDSYFWVISRFGQLDTATTLRAYSVGSILMGIVAFLTVWGMRAVGLYLHL